MSTKKDGGPAYSFIQYPYDEPHITPDTIIEHWVMDRDVSRDGMIEVFEKFLKASGFNFGEGEYLDVKSGDDSAFASVPSLECPSCKLNLHSLEKELLCYVRYIADHGKDASAESSIEQRNEFIDHAHKILNLIGEENV